MEMDVYLRFLLALIFTLSLIGLLWWLVRRYGSSRLITQFRAGSRLSVQEVRQLDARHRLVLVRRDSVEHLILLGTQSDLLIESGIAVPDGGSFRAALGTQAGADKPATSGGKPA